jgi:hypothetical protein
MDQTRDMGAANRRQIVPSDLTTLVHSFAWSHNPHPHLVQSPSCPGQQQTAPHILCPDPQTILQAKLYQHKSKPISQYQIHLTPALIMGQTPSTPKFLLPTFRFFKRKRRLSKPRTKQQWNAWRAFNKTLRRTLRIQGKLLTIPQARKALRRDVQRASGQRKNPGGNSKQQRRRRTWLWKQEKTESSRAWVQSMCHIQ